MFTIGHSNRSLDSFLALLRESGIVRLVDVRAIPKSRFNPQFNDDALPAGLEGVGASYEHAPALGGRRGRAPGVPPDTNGLWTNASFHNYADYALSDAFRMGLERLLNEGERERCAIMCSEAVWWRCHRRIIADHLLAREEPVVHIMAAGRTEPARLTPGAVVQADRTVIYPAPQRSLL